MTQPPPKGQMYLFDAVTPPLDDGSYRLTATTGVTYGPTQQSFSQQRYFDVVGPRFSVPQAMVAGTFPPSNGHGSFQDDLPHIVLSRRTLPWERALDPEVKIPLPARADGDPPPLDAPIPWVALLVFVEGEYTLLRGIPLQQAVPADVFERLGSPLHVTCDAVETSIGLLSAILPSLEELALLAHARWVNVDDRELNTAGGDGYYSVVVANRLPPPNAQCRAILVSLEERSDLVQSVWKTPEQQPPGPRPPVNPPVRTAATPIRSNGAAAVGNVPVDVLPNPIFGLSEAPVHTFGSTIRSPIGFVPLLRARLVALTSWQFTCEGPGTFRELMQNLDDAMFGTVAEPGHPALSDTGHLQLTLQDRLGAEEQVWYRGPLVQYDLTRDALGPYHSADQARRATPETGGEDVSYAAAFEAGRLLAAADARFAQAVMRWRRESYKQSARADTIGAISTKLPLDLPASEAERLHTPVAPIAANAAAAAVVRSAPPLGDPYGIGKTANAPGLDPGNLAAAWNLSSAAAASALLGADPGTLGAVVKPPPQTARVDTTLGAVAADTAGLERLAAARDAARANAVTTLGGQ